MLFAQQQTILNYYASPSKPGLAELTVQVYILFRTVKIIFPKRSLELFGRNKQADVESGSWNNKRAINWPMTRLWSSDIKRKGYLFTVKNGESLKLVQSLHKTKLLKSYIIDSYNSGKTAGTLFLLLVKILWPHKVVLFLGYWGILKAFPGKWAAKFLYNEKYLNFPLRQET